MLSRVDGTTTVKQIVSLVGGMFPEPKTVEILKKLKRAGAIAIGAPVTPVATGTPATSRSAGMKTTGSTRAAAPFVPRNAPDEPRRKAVTPAATPAVAASASRPAPVLDPAILAEVVELDEAQKRRILEFHMQLSELTYFELLGVAEDSDKKDVKRAYFKLSKEFHPDRFYKKQLGSYGERLGAIFKTLTVAFDTVSDDALRVAYVQALKSRRR